MRNKFSHLQEVINENVGIVSIAKTKIDASSIVLDGYHLPYSMDVTEWKEGILVYVKSRFRPVDLLLEIYVILFKLFLLK